MQYETVRGRSHSLRLESAEPAPKTMNSPIIKMETVENKVEAHNSKPQLPPNFMDLSFVLPGRPSGLGNLIFDSNRSDLIMDPPQVVPLDLTHPSKGSEGQTTENRWDAFFEDISPATSPASANSALSSYLQDTASETGVQKARTSHSLQEFINHAREKMDNTFPIERFSTVEDKHKLLIVEWFRALSNIRAKVWLDTEIGKELTDLINSDAPNNFDKIYKNILEHHNIPHQSPQELLEENSEKIACDCYKCVVAEIILEKNNYDPVNRCHRQDHSFVLM